MIGTTLSHFRVTAKLGEGGMGEVYRAEDTKLGREVAIKVLPEAVATDPERLARFEREAKVLASLNHQNIAAIYSFESAQREGASPSPTLDNVEQEGSGSKPQDPSPASPRPQDLETPGPRTQAPGPSVHFLVMELVEGEDLKERIERGPIAIEEAMPIGLQISQALEAAHERGIIHRDLKPANIKIDGEGNVKVLDFGLAKALDPMADSNASGTMGSGKSPSVIPLSMSPTLTAQMTGAGVILGTASYMSPEQAKGRAADKRADIWSFGVVIFEMLVGKMLFEAESVAETLGAIFQQEIDLDALPSGTPRRLRGLLERCLERDPKQRLRDIGEARIALDAIANGESSGDIALVTASTKSSGISPLLFALVLLGVGIAAVWIGTRLRSSPEKAPLEVTEFGFEVEDLHSADLSRDGRRLAFTDGSKVFIRNLDDRRPRAVFEKPNIQDLFWSPDGQELAIDVDEQLWRVNVDTGESELICDLPDLPRVPRAFILAGAWRPDGTILFALWRGGIYRVPSRGGAPEIQIPIDPDVDVDFHRIVPLPDSEFLLLAAHYQDAKDTGRESNFAIERYRNGERTIVSLPDPFKDMAPLGYFDNRILLIQLGDFESHLWGLPFDPVAADFTAGEPELLISDIELALLATNGTVAYLSKDEEPKIVARVDRAGGELATLAEPQSTLGFPTLSPEGGRLATVIDGSELWVHDLERDTSTRLVSDEDFIVDPQWSADGESLYYTVENRSILRRIRAIPGAEAETVDDEAYRSFIAPDDSGVLIHRGGFQLQEAGGLHWFPFNENGQLGEGREILPGFVMSGRLSPSGQLVAFRTGADGPPEAFVSTFPDTDQTIQLSSGGAGTPRWSHDNQALYYLSRGSLIEVEVGIDENGRLKASPEKPLFRLEEAGLRTRGGWDVTKDGFLFIKPLVTDDLTEIVIRRHALAQTSSR